ncbi:iron complex outermembrane receptor protein [Anseongella ginsenosidimutans]|uniref:Iron complex outermembrane receptor protein n=1 Tax=Anseongella ginsenosidimutans TaxID=496056 RepID=A0A4R3KUY9_9SPHI|nr:TonB-dependent receptor [Anseongella ginsenosidimutans]QEC51758.1 TonB-dependent receptor [Anseongella ginsenosidimutans]TCS89125.1 iron complex outermembrane receptor protein [Anseongella ginsenosidimutans]
MKTIFVILMTLISSACAFGQHVLNGVIRDKISGAPLPGATIRLQNTFMSTQADASGHFQFTNLQQGSYILQITFIGYATAELPVSLPQSESLEIALEPKTYLTEEVIVTATRASANSATAFSNISKEYLEKQNLGQDLPYLLNMSPSVVVSSDAGNGVGYTGIRIRGSDNTRVNLTINGIPLNDAESQGTFLVNLPDFASSVDNLQIQRGVGTSTNGAGAFGGSINIQTTKAAVEPYASVDNSYGSFNTLKNTVSVGTGLINKAFSFNGRLSRISSDGFVDRAASQLHSFFLNGTYQGKKDLLSFNVFSGKEETYQAWNGIPEARLRGDHEGMEDFIARNGLNDSEADLLLNSGSRTYNQFTYKDQTDNYQQDHYQALYSHQFARELNANLGLHLTKGKGYYEELQAGQDFADYGLENIITGGDTIRTTDLVRRRWLDNTFYGVTYSLNYEPTERSTFTLGGAYNEYRGNHFGEITWAQFASGSFKDERYYDNDAFKTDFNVYGKLEHSLTEQLSIFADIQYRRVFYSFLGFDRNGKNVQQDVSLDFFNPKAGLSFRLNAQQRLYASFSMANKEPNRDDYTESTPGSRPSPERLYDLEAGWNGRFKNGSFGLNYYLMSYRDQLILTGKINDVGSYTRVNIPRSYRTGLELYGSVRIHDKVSWTANATFSINKIREFTEYLDNYDSGAQEAETYKETDIAFSPGIIAGSELVYQPFPRFSAAFMSKYVGKQYLDNTSSESRRLDPWFVNDIRAAYSFPVKGFKELRATLLVNNIFDTEYESNGYTYGYISGGETTRENFYFPQAGVHFLAGLSLKF